MTSDQKINDLIELSIFFWIMVQDAEPVIEHVKTEWENSLDVHICRWLEGNSSLVGSSANNDHYLTLALAKSRLNLLERLDHPKTLRTSLCLQLSQSLYLLPHTLQIYHIQNCFGGGTILGYL